MMHHFCWAKKVAMEFPLQPRLQGGINAVANAVKVTLGPKGRNVVLQRESFQALGRRWVTWLNDDVWMDRTWTFRVMSMWDKGFFGVVIKVGGFVPKWYCLVFGIADIMSPICWCNQPTFSLQSSMSSSSSCLPGTSDRQWRCDHCKSHYFAGALVGWWFHMCQRVDQLSCFSYILYR